MPDLFLMLAPVLAAALVAQASPGPATLAISREAMLHGRTSGIALALGVTTGSWIWSAIAAGGMSAIILANEWAVIGLRFFAAAYLAWLALKSAKAAIQNQENNSSQSAPRAEGSYMRGLLIHLTNPKAILFFGALYAFGLPVGATSETVLIIASAVALQSVLIFVGLAVLFSHRGIAQGYWRFRRVLESVFAVVFGSAAASFLLDALQSLGAKLQRV
ncbi:LysE family transporter [uncultured Marivita sp.]|uniref:LysE family translocator n=1 Tax=uncultured Marivita sp. TaxID=888080 RepID=UPI0026085495|nr:LysE family transporter [uncultured Marivita sp.]